MMLTTGVISRLGWLATVFSWMNWPGSVRSSGPRFRSGSQRQALRQRQYFWPSSGSGRADGGRAPGQSASVVQVPDTATTRRRPREIDLTQRELCRQVVPSEHGSGL